TWRFELGKRLNAGQDVRPELLEGAAIVKRAGSRLQGAAGKQLLEAAARLADGKLTLEERLKLAFADEVAALLNMPLSDGDATRLEQPLELFVDRVEAAFSAWYELFPRSQSETPGKHGTFKDSERR